MLTHTEKIKRIYERIQIKIQYMIPEKWEKIYLYCSIINSKEQKGELYFYYVPKGILKKAPINVYEIPSKFNLDESEYIELVEELYLEFKNLREEFKQRELFKMWSNLNLIIENNKFKIEYFYENLKSTEEENEERHIIWRYRYLGEYFKCTTKKEKQIISSYLELPDSLIEKEEYVQPICMANVRNMVEYDTYHEVKEEAEELKLQKIRFSKDKNRPQVKFKRAFEEVYEEKTQNDSVQKKQLLSID